MAKLDLLGMYLVLIDTIEDQNKSQIQLLTYLHNKYYANWFQINIENKKDFYFSHSFALKCNNKSDILTYTNYGKKFVSSINKENIYGVQFHPEKSLRYGLQLIKNFLSL